MKSHKNLKPDENLASLVSALDRCSVSVDREFLVELRERSATEFAASTSTNWAKSIPIAIWRTAMKSPMTKFAAAAVVAIACVIGLSLWRATGSGVTLAAVLEKIGQVRTYTYQTQSTMTRGQATCEWTSNVLVSNAHGIKVTVTSADSNEVGSERRLPNPAVGDETYLLPPSSSLVFVSHEDKTYDRFAYDGVKLDYYKEEYNEPHTIIKQILRCKHTSLGQSVIDGITVEGFQTEDLAYEGGFFGEADLQGNPEKIDVKLWVDVETFLPVRLQEDILTQKGVHIYEISYDFHWNVIVDQQDFEPNIPPEYRAPAGDIVIKSSNEDSTIKSFRLWAGTFRKYPENLDNIGQAYREAAGVDRNSMKKLYETMSDEERTKKTAEVMEMITPGLLYGSLVAQGKDPAYYGQTVQPGEAEKVLLRWRLDDGQYHVIFGDLSVRTVSPEQLAELEKPRN